MKAFLIALALLLAIGGWSLAQDPRIDCATWGSWGNEQKTLFLAGYSESIAMLGFAGAVGGQSADAISKVIHAMWPQGYNLGNLGDELDKLCSMPAFNKMRVNLVISGVAAKVQRPK